MADERGDFVIRPGRGPRIVRASRSLGSTVPTEYSEQVLDTAPVDEESMMDSLLQGINQRDLGDGGKLSGFGSHLRTKSAAAGAGPDVTSPPRRSDFNYDAGPLHDERLDMGDQTNQGMESDNLFDQPESHEHQEYGDFIEEEPYEKRADQGNALSQDDIWSRDLFEDFEENRRDDTTSVDDPTFSGEPHRQLEASMMDELTDLFEDGGSSFLRRKL